jgi:hypothetical protein
MFAIPDASKTPLDVRALVRALALSLCSAMLGEGEAVGATYSVSMISALYPFLYLLYLVFHTVLPWLGSKI